ncbi:hypothetical protein LX36DRAFT_3855 [Colletotrichum falcatum]|nr:hypothetical protein LX36DRAFT_3855 [Colletotrichum falcatum]
MVTRPWLISLVVKLSALWAIRQVRKSPVTTKEKRNSAYASHVSFIQLSMITHRPWEWCTKGVKAWARPRGLGRLFLELPTVRLAAIGSCRAMILETRHRAGCHARCGRISGYQYQFQPPMELCSAVTKSATGSG